MEKDYGISINSEPDEGTTVLMHLPAVSYEEIAKEEALKEQKCKEGGETCLEEKKILLCIGAVFLVLLFLLSSTDLIIKERAVQIDSISVILSEDTDDYYQNFRKGMEKAATDLRSDVRLITLYDRKDQEQQVELTTREIRDGAGAVVIEPAEEKAAVMALESLNPGCPVIFVSASSPVIL